MTGPAPVTVNFLGPFLRYCEEPLEVTFEEGMTVLDTIEEVAAKVGQDFRRRALEPTTTVIRNKTILNWEDREDVALSPGDNITFALFIGGG